MKSLVWQELMLSSMGESFIYAGVFLRICCVFVFCICVCVFVYACGLSSLVIHGPAYSALQSCCSHCHNTNISLNLFLCACVHVCVCVYECLTPYVCVCVRCMGFVLVCMCCLFLHVCTCTRTHCEDLSLNRFRT